MKIRVNFTRSENQPNGIHILDLETEYLPNVIPVELSESWTDPPNYGGMTYNQALELSKAQTIAARTFAVRKINRNRDKDFDVDDTTAFQAFKLNRSEAICDDAISQTKGEVLFYNDEIISAVYTSSNGGKTLSCQERWGSYKPYLISKVDPYSASTPFRGHGVGMSQYGAYNRAKSGQSYLTILSFYYDKTRIVRNYGGIKMNENISNNELRLKECILTENDCYKSGKLISPIGIMVHSTGANNKELRRYIAPDDGIIGVNKYNNHWNQPDHAKCVHGFIGEGVDGQVYTYKTLPFEMKGWHAGGSANNTHIGFEIQESSESDVEYFNNSYNQAVLFCAYLCKSYSLTQANIISHKEGHLLGTASNHGDADAWFKVYGKSMDIFREDVRKALNDGVSIPEIPTDPIEPEYPEYYKVNVTNYLNVRLEPYSDATRIGKLDKNEVVLYYGENSNGWMKIENDNVSGWVYGKYLLPTDKPNPPIEIPDTEDPTEEETFDKVEVNYLFEQQEENDVRIDELAEEIDSLTDKNDEIREKLKKSLDLI